MNEDEVKGKGVGFPESTWEPTYIYLGQKVPKPNISHTKKIGDTVIHKRFASVSTNFSKFLDVLF